MRFPILLESKSKIKKLAHLCGLLLSSMMLSYASFSVAQVIPDTTLGEESSAVVPGQNNGQRGNRQQSEIVTGGAARGTNLFHSFEAFSIPKGQRIDFLNPNDITHIFSRVTGDLPSDIQGTLGVLGNADLFLINNNGINFGPTARLDVGGSFLATTANSVQFSDGVEFSTDDIASPLLTTNIPVGLGFLDAAPIAVRNEGREIVNDILFDALSPRAGLAAPPSETLAIIGGDINIEGGILRSLGGNIELGSVQQGTVDISLADAGIFFSYQDVDSFGDVRLSQLSLIDVSSLFPSQIRMVGQDVILRDGSLALVRSSEEGLPGHINISASRSLQIGQSSRPEILVSAVISQNLGSGMGANVSIDAPQVTVQNGGQVIANAYASGPSGSILINAPDLISVDGFSSVSEDIPSSITTGALGPGRSGLFSINAGEIRVSSGAQIGAIAGVGTPGSVDITADDITIEGALPTLLKPSFLGIATAGNGRSGQLLINTDTLRVVEGGAVGTTSIGAGDAGDTVIRADEFIEVSGSFPGALNPSSIDSSIALINPITELLFRVAPPTLLSGNAGSISLATPRLMVSGGGAIRVQNDGAGDAGNLNIATEQLQVDSSGQISAVTNGGQGGSIGIDSSALVLSDQSVISASATGEGQGGNVAIESDVIGLLRNSSIRANAEQGFGGQVIILTDALLQDVDSTVTATSEAGSDLGGFVDIQSPDGTIQTETETATSFVDVPRLAAVCAGGLGQGSEFRVRGSGGLPISPGNLQQSYSGWPSQPSLSAGIALPEPRTTIVEAQGWVSDADGTVSLIAERADSTYPSAQNTTCINRFSQPS